MNEPARQPLGVAAGDSSSTGGRILGHLHELVEVIGARPAGSPSNERATRYVRSVMERSGLAVREHRFSTRWWEPGPVELLVDGERMGVTANPYSPAVDAVGAVEPFPRAEAAQRAGAILLVGEDVVSEPLMPRAFPFFAPTADAQLLARIEALHPKAVITVSAGRPIIEDPDVAFPSLTVGPEVGRRLAGRRVRVRIAGAVHVGEGATLSSRSGPPGRRVLVCAHLDTVETTPGAVDNAGGVAALLAWAQRGLPAQHAVELVFFNGEDHFDAGGEVAWLADADLAEIAGAVNLDGAGMRGHATGAVLMGGSPQQAAALDEVITRHGWETSEPWYQSDHAIFAMQGIPSLAVTTADGHTLVGSVIHTAHDTLEVVDLEQLVDLTEALDEIVDCVADR